MAVLQHTVGGNAEWVVPFHDLGDRSVPRGIVRRVVAFALTILCVLGLLPHAMLAALIMVVTLPAMLVVMLTPRAEYAHAEVDPNTAPGYMA